MTTAPLPRGRHRASVQPLRAHRLPGPAATPWTGLHLRLAARAAVALVGAYLFAAMVLGLPTSARS